MKKGKSFQAEGTACAKASRQEKPYVHRMLEQVVEGEREKTGNSQRPAANSWWPFSNWVKGAIGPAFCGSEENDQRSGASSSGPGDLFSWQWEQVGQESRQRQLLEIPKRWHQYQGRSHGHSPHLRLHGWHNVVSGLRTQLWGAEPS